MSSVTLGISESIHQGDERFSENSRGRQRAFNPFMSLTAPLYDQRRISKFICGLRIQSTKFYPRETDCLSLPLKIELLPMQNYCQLTCFLLQFLGIIKILLGVNCSSYLNLCCMYCYLFKSFKFMSHALLNVAKHERNSK